MQICVVGREPSPGRADVLYTVRRSQFLRREAAGDRGQGRRRGNLPVTALVRRAGRRFAQQLCPAQLKLLLREFLFDVRRTQGNVGVGWTEAGPPSASKRHQNPQRASAKATLRAGSVPLRCPNAACGMAGAAAGQAMSYGWTCGWPRKSAGSCGRQSVHVGFGPEQCPAQLAELARMNVHQW